MGLISGEGVKFEDLTMFIWERRRICQLVFLAPSPYFAPWLNENLILGQKDAV